MKAYVVINTQIHTYSFSPYEISNEPLVDFPFPFFFDNENWAKKYVRGRDDDPEKYLKNEDKIIECEIEGEYLNDIPGVGYLVTTVDYDCDNDDSVCAAHEVIPHIFKRYNEPVTEDNAYHYCYDEAYQQARLLGLGKNAVSPAIKLMRNNCYVQFVRNPQGLITKAWFCHPILPASNKLINFDIH